jgi:hypothetical protein
MRDDVTELNTDLANHMRAACASSSHSGRHLGAADADITTGPYDTQHIGTYIATTEEVMSISSCDNAHCG